MEQVNLIPEKITPTHLKKKAVVYIRQSTMQQVLQNQESTRRQYALQEKAYSLGWPRESIVIIDEDLGISGSGRVARPGFLRLMSMIPAGEVGAVFGLEISRLARSSADMMKMIELCGLFDTLVIDEERIYDISNVDDRMIIGFKSTIGEVELRIIHNRMIGGKINAAKRGDLRSVLPVGYVYDGKTPIIDPDESVRNAIQTVFDQFANTHSAYQVVKYFAENNLLFPKRAYGGAWDGKIKWGSLGHSRVLGIIHNPYYAGVYTYGRYQDHKNVDGQGYVKHHYSRVKDFRQSTVCIEGHHPAYITIEQYEENLAQLERNTTNNETCGPAKDGAALLAGIIYCSKCGRMMSPRYTGNGGIRPVYECRGKWEHGNRAVCTTIPAYMIDKAVTDRILFILNESNFDLTLDALSSINEDRKKTDKQWEIMLERARYESARAERQYHLADPENRLVVRSLESNWEEKLKELSKLEQEYKAHCSKKIPIPSSEEKQAIRDLSRKIPLIWASPNTSNADRKRIIRSIIEDVTVTASSYVKEYTVGIRYRSGKSEQITQEKKLPSPPKAPHVHTTVDRVCELAASYTDSEIADKLNEEGLLTPEGNMFTVGSVRYIRQKHHIAGLYQSPNGGMSIEEAAAFFGVGKSIIYYKIEAGILPAKKERPNWPWRIFIDDADVERLKKLVLNTRQFASNEISVRQAAEIFDVKRTDILEAIKCKILNAYQARPHCPWHIMIDENNMEQLQEELKRLKTEIPSFES